MCVSVCLCVSSGDGAPRIIKQQSPGLCRIIWAVQLYSAPGPKGKGGHYCVSGGATKVIHVSDWVTGQELLALRGHQEGVRCLAIALDGTLASGSNDFTVRLW
jgi:WD40 repeat protein